MSEGSARRKFWADEIFILGVVIAAFIGAELYTWKSVSEELGFRGLFFLGITGVGVAAYAASGTFGMRRLFLPRPNWKDLATVAVVSVVGIVATRLLQSLILQLSGGSVLATFVPAELQRVYLAEAALAETCFVVGLFTLLCRIHWVVGLVVMTLISAYLHLYVYALLPGAIPAVAASFALQFILLVATRHPSVPLVIHVGMNL